MIWVVEWMAEYDSDYTAKGWRPWIVMESLVDRHAANMDLEGDDLTEVIDRLIYKEKYNDAEDGFHVRIRNTETGETIPMEALCL